jgi:hypothetical protein
VTEKSSTEKHEHAQNKFTTDGEQEQLRLRVATEIDLKEALTHGSSNRGGPKSEKRKLEVVADSCSSKSTDRRPDNERSSCGTHSCSQTQLRMKILAGLLRSCHEDCIERVGTGRRTKNERSEDQSTEQTK